VMASVTLLVWSGLLIRALQRIDARDPGFRTAGVLTARTALPRPKYTLATRRHQFYDEVLGDLRRLPGVQSAAYISFLPMTMGGGIFPVGLPGEAAAMHTGHVASMRYATPGFFQTLGIPMREGRDFAESDTLSHPMVAIVSQSFVDRYLPGPDAVGRRFDFAYSTRTIVAVVGDVRVRGPERNSEPQVYLPYTQVNDESFPFFTPKDLAVRTSLPPETIVPALRRIVAAADREQPVSNVRWLDEIVEHQTETRAVQVRVLAAFAAIALVLAAVGVHGLLAFVVSQRRHEIGVRMALGADPGRIVRGIVRQSAVLAALGLIPGLALAYAGGRVMESLLAGVTPGDGATLAVAALLSGLMTLAGSLSPALRAVRVPPASVFRGD
jgi:predicted permease